MEERREGEFGALRRRLVEEEEPEEGVRVVEVRKVVRGSQADAFDLFREEGWLQTGIQIVPMFGWLPKPFIKAEGGENFVGEVRTVPFKSLPMVDEMILECEPGKYLVYTLLNHVPVSYYRGRVEFVELSEGRTEITWRIKMVAYSGFGGFLSFFFRHFFRLTLNAVAKASKREKRD